ncbi:MAG: MFS transporter, partial [bacterium]|nr:MFS transporter [bacterium]
GGYGRTFAFTGVCFFISGLVVFALREPGDGFKPALERKRDTLKAVYSALRNDANLRRLVAVAMLFGAGLIIFPHYQALAREELGLSGVHLMVWVITQNAAVGVLSLIVGPLADRKGNRLTLQILLFSSAIAPAYAIALPHVPGGDRIFWLVFIPLAVVPLVLRLLVNYSLEICEPEQHARYLSTVSLG